MLPTKAEEEYILHKTSVLYKKAISYMKFYTLKKLQDNWRLFLGQILLVFSRTPEVEEKPDRTIQNYDGRR